MTSHKVANTGFTVGFMSINNPGLTTNLSLTATNNKNGKQVRCRDVIDTNEVIYITSMNSDLFFYITDVIRSSFLYDFNDYILNYNYFSL